MKVGILGSTQGSNLLPLMEILTAQDSIAKISVVISNQEQAGILEKARSQSCPAFYIDAKDKDRAAYDQLISAKLKEYKIDLVILMGYMRILSDSFVSEWAHRVFNVHPSLLPAFAGKIDLAVHKAVLDAGHKESGCTVHEVTNLLDGGPILIQKKCAVYPEDTPETLKKRVQQLEILALTQAIHEFKPGNFYANY